MSQSAYTAPVQERSWLLVLRLAALCALAFSAALYVDYMIAPTFCASGSGCATVRNSGFGWLPVPGRQIGIPVPLIGMIGFGTLLVLSLLPGRPARLLLTLGATFGGLLGVGLIFLQAVRIGQYCALCVVVDISSLLAALAALGAWFAARKKSTSGAQLVPAVLELRAWAWVALGLLAVLLPTYWPKFRPKPPVPAAVAQLYVPGKINVVEFADFQCPFCRQLHGRLKAIIAEHLADVNFVRLNMPLAMHRDAQHAARVAVCAAQQGHGDAMADELFQSDSLAPEETHALAVRLGLDVPAFEACIAAPQTDQRIADEAQILRDAGFRGLPTTFVGAAQIVGAQPDEVFRDAFEHAKLGRGDLGVPGPAYAGFGILLSAAVVGLGRRRNAAPAPTQRSAS